MIIKKNPRIIAVIPAFNEEQTIESIVKEVISKVAKIIVVDDGSTDLTCVLAKRSGATTLVNNKNLGYEKALSIGFKKAIKEGADIVLTFDADGESLPGEIMKLAKPIIQNRADVTIGRRGYRRHFAEKIFSFYTRIFYGISDPLCGMKMYKKEVYTELGHFDTMGACGAQLALEAINYGFRVKEVKIATARRLDKSRFYNNSLRANVYLLRALTRMIAMKYKK